MVYHVRHFSPCWATIMTEGPPQLNICPVYGIQWIPFVLHDIFRTHLSVGVSVHIFSTDGFTREVRMQLFNHWNKKDAWCKHVSPCLPRD